MPTTHYDHIAHDYQESKFAPWRIHIERHTLFSLVGDLNGKSVLDMACGDGIYWDDFLKDPPIVFIEAVRPRS